MIWLSETTSSCRITQYSKQNIRNLTKSYFGVHQTPRLLSPNRIRNMSSNSKGSPYDAKMVSVEPLEQGKWIQTRKLNYKDPRGQDRVWEMAIRTTRSETTNIDGVAIVALLDHPDKKKEIVLTRQFRPPVEKVVIELPAGLIDSKESVEATAVRELIEETGYHGTYKYLTESMANLVSDPGLTNANMAIAYVDVDLTRPENVNPQAQLEEGEFIDSIVVPFENLLEELHSLVKDEGCVIDARLYHFAVGIDLAKSL